MNMYINKHPDEHREQVVNFNDQTADWVYSVPSMPDTTYSAAETQDATLEEFFARPVRIASYTWTPGTAFFQYLDPWTSFFHNVRVVNRINNYYMIRAKLHVKMMINGNGFYYGRVLAAYTPRPTEIFGSPLPRALVPQDMIQMSQIPHVYLDPTTSQGGSLELPFFCPANAISITGDTFAQMGAITFRDLNVLQHANGGTSPVTISVFAWATDVHLSIPTSTRNGSITAQAGDEYATGPISRPAATIARAAGALAKVPSIAPYAKATQVAAGAVGTVASLFGYSRPTQEAPSETVKPEFVGVLANSNAKDNATKLTMDCKQEVTVDPRVVGLGDSDEMTILSLSQRESYLTTFGWSDSQAPDTLLYAKYVTPMSYALYSTGLTQEVHLTPCAFAALPFKYWRGTMKFRFQIVASAFHKGRLRIVYDPTLLQSASVGEFNINYSHIADLAGDRDFTLEFGWGQITSWMPVLDLPTSAVNAPSGQTTGVLTTPPQNVGANGLFSVIVVNELTSTATTTPPVYVNVFVSTSDDFEVCVPECDHLLNLSYAAGVYSGDGPPSRQFESQAGDSDPVDPSTEDTPVQQEVELTMAPKLSTRDHTLSVFFGDPITSFRQCLKRYEFSRAWQVPYLGGSPYTQIRFQLPDVPLYRGAVAGAIDTGIDDNADPVAWNYVKFTLLNYLLPAYAARRGGLRWKYHLTGNTNLPSYLAVTRESEAVGLSTTASTIPDWSDGQTNVIAQFLNDNLPHTWCATHVTDVRNNPVLEVELPYYWYLRFYGCRDLNMATPGRLSTSYHVLTGLISNDYSPSVGSIPMIHSYVSTAEDFSLHFFSGVPPIFMAVAPPALVIE